MRSNKEDLYDVCNMHERNKICLQTFDRKPPKKDTTCENERRRLKHIEIYFKNTVRGLRIK